MKENIENCYCCEKTKKQEASNYDEICKSCKRNKKLDDKIKPLPPKF